MVTPHELAQSPLFVGVPAESLARFTALGEEVHCSAGEMLFREGKEATHLYLLLRGKVNVQVQPTSLTAPLTFVSISTFGQLVGWSGFMPPHYYTATALCLEDCDLLAFEGAAFSRALDADPAVGLVVMRHIAEVISQRLRTIQGVVIKSLYHLDEQ